MIVVDTGVIFAVAARADGDHHACDELLATYPGELMVPTPVIVESSWLIESRLGPGAEAAFEETTDGHHSVAGWARLVRVSIGDELLEERRRRRRAGDPRLSETDRQLLGRIVDGDLADEFQAALDAVSAADPLLGGDNSDA